jgi:hypothetical protein
MVDPATASFGGNFFLNQVICMGLITVVSPLSTQLEPRSFVRTLPVGVYFRRSIPKLPTFRCNVEEIDRQAPE